MKKLNICIVEGGTGETGDQITNRLSDECNIERVDKISDIYYYQPDLIVLLGYREIITDQNILDNYLIVNLHPSMLPDYKGMDPVERQMKDKNHNFGITLHLVDKTVDGGDIIEQRPLTFDNVILHGQQTANSIYQMLREEGIEMISNFIQSMSKIYNLNKMFFLLGESGCGKSYIRDMMEKLNIKTVDTPWNDLSGIDDLGRLQLEFMQSIGKVCETIRSEGVFIEGDPISTMAFTELADLDHFEIMEVEDEWMDLMDEFSTEMEYIIINRDRDTIKEFRENRNRDYEYHESFSKEDQELMHERIMNRSMQLLKGCDVNWTTWNLERQFGYGDLIRRLEKL